MGLIKAVLFVDDDSITNFINERLISRMNIASEIYITTNPLDAIGLLKEMQVQGRTLPEIIFVDINMPIMDGFEFLKAFHELRFSVENQIKLAVLTTSNNELDLERISEFSNVCHITKPLTRDKMLDFLKTNFEKQTELNLK